MKGFPDQGVIKQSDNWNIHNKPLPVSEQKYLDFRTMPWRGEFVRNVSSMIPSDERFDMNENYDRSTYLTKVRRIQGRDFASYAARRSDLLVQQGGDPQQVDIIQKGARPEEFYIQDQKEKNLMQRLDKNCLGFEKYDKRSEM